MNVEQTLTLLLTLLIAKAMGSSVLVADFRMTRMVELSSRTPYCKIHSDRGDIQRMLLAFDAKKVRQVPRESVIALEEVCNEASGISGELQGGLGFIYPGTKWCGPGSIAANYSDVGRYADEDRCCREHDMCPNILLPGECRRGLCNRGAFTRSHCDCDARFRRCLQNLNTETANTLGAVFFNVIQVTCFSERRPCSIWQRLRCSCDAQFFSCLRNVATFFSYAVSWIYSKAQAFCFEHEYPVVKCTQSRNDGFISTTRCLEYLVDNSSPKSWQWFNIPHLSANLTCFPSVINEY